TRMPTVEVTRPSAAAIVFRDEPSETHGPYVVTRGTHTISIPERFRIAAFPVTNALFGEFILAGGYQLEEFWGGVPQSARSSFICQDGTPGPSTWASTGSDSELPDNPVAGVSYYEALAFLAWLDRTL